MSINARSINDNIIRVEDNHYDSCVKIYCKIDPEKIVNVLRYLRCNGWKDFKFNQYSIRKEFDEYVVNINYVKPTLNLKF